MANTIPIYSIIFLIISIASFCSCKKNYKKDSMDLIENSYKNPRLLSRDTMTKVYPTSIGNNEALIHISEWIVEFDHRGKEYIIELKSKHDSLNVRINNQVIVDNFQALHANSRFKEEFKLKGIIRDLEFDFIRANTLYFNASLLNSQSGEITPTMIQLVYRGQRKEAIHASN